MHSTTHHPAQDERGSVLLKVALVAVAVIGLAHLAAFVALTAMQRAHAGRTLPAVYVGPHHVGGLERDDLDTAVRRYAREHRNQTVTVKAEDYTVRSTRGAIGLTVDAEETADAVWARGRSGFYRAVFDQLAVRAGNRIEVPFEHELDEAEFRDWARSASERLSREPRPAGIGFIHAADPDEVDVHIVEPRDGWQVSAARLARRLRPEVIDTTGPVRVDVAPRTTRPDITRNDAERMLDEAETAVSAPLVLQNPSEGPNLELSRVDLALILSVERRADAPGGERLEITADPSTLEERISPEQLAAIEEPPVDASFEIVGDEVVIHGGLPGFELDAEETARRLEDIVVQPAPRAGELAGAQTPPDFTRAEAEALGITERVSTFTTPFQCCPPRVHNIQLAADILRGTIIRPGERFSLNQDIGPRTRPRGFVSNGYIEDGELRTAVGGGVSQIGTTFFNAAWFAGIRLVDFKPHSLYIDRYPMGREATLDWNVIDVVVENDSPYGILVHTSYTNTSVTFEFWSTGWAEVESETIGPFNRREGSKRDGFDVIVRRTVTYPDGTTSEEEYFHRYEPED